MIQMEDEEMEFLDGRWEKEVTDWDTLLGDSVLNETEIGRAHV